jgi:6-pyruvoyltetrahydropterin/6-carboxytetrahydropterin synthase
MPTPISGVPRPERKGKIMYRITKEFHFSASHQLFGLPDDHQCSRLHGHNYIAVIELASDTLNAHGFVRDYLELAPLKRYIDDALDHRHLNDVLGDDCVTAERMAKHLYDWCAARWPETAAVRVSETPKTWAEYRP